MKCYRCPATEKLTKDHIIPKRYNSTSDKLNIMILCRPCHDFKEKYSKEIITDGKVIGIYNPILEKNLMFSRYKKRFRDGKVRTKPFLHITYKSKKIKKPKQKSLRGKLTVIKKPKFKKPNNNEIIAFTIINNTIEYRGSLERAKQILKETFKK